MKPILRLICVVMSCAVCTWSATAGQIAQPKTGGVLLLKSLRAFEGDIQRQGDQYLIKRGQSELSLPAEQALMLFADWEQAFAFMASRANLRDPDERIRLAKWCRSNGLSNQALNEVNAALEMRPNDGEAKHLREMLQRQDREKPATKIATSKKKLPPKKPEPIIDVDTRTLAIFTTRVQPILMNTCLRCHSHGEGGAFQLQRTHIGSRRSLTQRNLAAVMLIVDRADPDQSMLLLKAIHAHGGGTRPPLKGKSSVPYQWLEKWVAMLLENNPHLREEKESKSKSIAKTKPAKTERSRLEVNESDEIRELPRETFAQKPAKPRTIAQQAGLENAEPINARPVPLEPNLAKTSTTEARQVTKDPTPEIVQTSGQEPAETQSADPYDPALFNQQIHPDATSNK